MVIIQCLYLQLLIIMIQLVAKTKSYMNLKPWNFTSRFVVRERGWDGVAFEHGCGYKHPPSST